MTYVVGIDLGGTNMQIGVVDDRHRIVAAERGRTEAQAGQEAVIERIVTGVHQACRQGPIAPDEIAAVGIAAPGAIDIPRGLVLEAPNLGWRRTPLRDILRDRFDRPVVVENDVNGAVWGEYRLGAGRGRGDILGIWVGTGVGGGLVLNGRIYHGHRYTAGEVGHTVIQPDAPPRSRTIEDLCSRTGMSRIIGDRLEDGRGSCLQERCPLGEEGVGTDALAEAFEAGDPLAVEVISKAAGMLGVALANWVTVLALDAVIVGGGVTEALGEPYLDLIRERFSADVFPADHRSCELRTTELRENAGLLGAALLALEAAEDG